MFERHKFTTTSQIFFTNHLCFCFKYNFAVTCSKWCWNWFQLSKMWVTQWMLMYYALNPQTLVLNKILFFHVFCQLSVFHGSFNKHYPVCLFCAAICLSKWSACFLARRENKLALFEFGCVLCRTVSCICFIPSLFLPWAMQWKRLGMKKEGVPDESKGGARKNRGRKLHSRIWNCSLRIWNFNWFA